MTCSTQSRHLNWWLGAILGADRLTTTEALLLMLVLNFQRGTVSAQHSSSDVRTLPKKVSARCVWTQCDRL
jgi:hypothetical protein